MTANLPTTRRRDSGELSGERKRSAAVRPDAIMTDDGWCTQLIKHGRSASLSRSASANNSRRPPPPVRPYHTTEQSYIKFSLRRVSVATATVTLMRDDGVAWTPVSASDAFWPPSHCSTSSNHTGNDSAAPRLTASKLPERFQHSSFSEPRVRQQDRQMVDIDSCIVTENVIGIFASVCDIRYDTRCYFNVRSKADISQLNLPHGSKN